MLLSILDSACLLCMAYICSLAIEWQNCKFCSFVSLRTPCSHLGFSVLGFALKVTPLPFLVHGLGTPPRRPAFPSIISEGIPLSLLSCVLHFIPFMIPILPTFLPSTRVSIFFKFIHISIHPTDSLSLVILCF